LATLPSIFLDLIFSAFPLKIQLGVINVPYATGIQIKNFPIKVKNIPDETIIQDVLQYFPN
jgi:hypothetical protein